MAYSDRFRTAENVKTYQENLKNFLGYEDAADQLKASKVLKEEIDRLETLYKILSVQETRFFNILGVKDINELISKIKEWDTSGADNLLSSSEKIWEVIEAALDDIKVEELNKKISEGIDQNEELKRLFCIEASESDSFDNKIEEIFNNINIKIKEGGTLSQIKIDKIKKYVVRDEVFFKNNKTYFKLQFTDETPVHYKSRIVQLINNENIEALDKIETMPLSKPEAVFNRIRHFFKEPASSFIQEEITKHFRAYGFKMNQFATKGAFGEIYWVSFFRWLTKDRIRVVPVGMETITSGVMKSKQIPIDILLESVGDQIGLGFQVKNYTLSNKGTVTYRNGRPISLKGFINNRLQIDPQEFKDFYFSWAYNKVATYSDAQETYQEVFDNFEAIMQDMDIYLENLSSQRLDRILRLDNKYTSTLDDHIDSFSGVKVNTFYLINNKPIPSSLIVKSLIDSLNNGKANVSFKYFTVDYTEPFANPVWNKKNDENPFNFMMGTKIAYEIEIDVSNLLAIALSRVSS